MSLNCTTLIYKHYTGNLKKYIKLFYILHSVKYIDNYFYLLFNFDNQGVIILYSNKYVIIVSY
jgi:hypothetical protein